MECLGISTQHHPHHQYSLVEAPLLYLIHGGDGVEQMIVGVASGTGSKIGTTIGGLFVANYGCIMSLSLAMRALIACGGVCEDLHLVCIRSRD